MYEVEVTMRDTNTDKLITRRIDGSNLMVSQNGVSQIASCPETQSKMLKQWISDRANEQHETILGLVSWFLVKVA